MEPINKIIPEAKILIVDDKQENVDLLEMMLSFSGYTNVQSATDPREVFDLHRKNSFDIILLDIRMPHLDGFQVMDMLSKDLKDDYLPVLVLTAQNDAETKEKALSAGAKDFVTKPFDKTEVLNRIRNMLEVRLLYKDRLEAAKTFEQRVHDRTHELRETRNMIIQRLGRAAEFRDNETGMHVVRVGKYCEILALGFGLPAEVAELIKQASPMHDVGKIGIPDQILLKPGKLTEEEFDIIKTHSRIGSDIIGTSKIKLMSTAQKIALYHHEKWDGSGYPNAVKGNTIPLEARVVAICDVFDALTSPRPYKEPWSLEKTIQFIKEQSGKHFDPDLVDVFMAVLPEIIIVMEKYGDEAKP